MNSPINPVDEEAIDLAKSLMALDIGVLASTQADGYPYASRIGITLVAPITPMTLISDLAHHTAGLRGESKCSILLGNAAAKGDALTQARMSLVCKAHFIEQGTKEDAELRKTFVAQRPSSKVYAGFADFHVATFEILRADLNGGFGKAYQFSAQELRAALSS